jgi:hypothetical protein
MRNRLDRIRSEHDRDGILEAAATPPELGARDLGLHRPPVGRLAASDPRR